MRKVEHIYRLPRIWSNKEIKKFSHLFTGDIINVSAWKDNDKMGNKYQDYFKNAKSYSISNIKSESRGAQGLRNEIILDLTKNLDSNLINKYDVVFNHTTLEHIYDFENAFKNLCQLSKDIVIIVVPFMQRMHTASYSDFWRFSPSAIRKMFLDYGLELLYLSFNDHKYTSVYIFAIGSKKPPIWREKFNYYNDKSLRENDIGKNAIDPYPYLLKIRLKIENFIISLLKKLKISI